MTEKICNFTLVSVLLLGLCAIGLDYTIQQFSFNNIIRIGENENQSITRTIVNNYWSAVADDLGKLQTLDNSKLRQNPTVIELGDSVRKVSRDLNLLKLAVYALNGHTIFSTTRQELGENHGDDSQFIMARAGKMNSRLEHRPIVNTPNDMKLDRYVVISYFPVYTPGTTKVEAVYEVVDDVTEFSRISDKNSLIIDLFTGLVYFVTISFILAGVREKNQFIAEQSALIEKQEARLEHKSSHDPLTGLPNRELFCSRLQQNMENAEESEKLLAVMVISLYRLQKINDTLGYRYGDGLLLETSQRLKQCIRRKDTVGRLSGDKFVAVLQDINMIDQVEEVAEHILEAVSEPYYIENNELFIFPSIGISMFPFANDDSADNLIRQANAAMYKAQGAGRNTFRFYNPIISKQATSRFTIETALRRALERNEFELHYQPIILLRSKEVYGMEALLRWRSPDFGMVSPLEFIPLLEETGMIKQVGQWVLEETCRQGVLLHSQGYRDLKMHVNVSAIQFLQKEIVRQVENAIESTGIQPHLLDLEITESLLINGVNQTIETLDTLNAMGVSLSIDDFGTGYSSLSYLKRLPIDTLKIDRYFVRDIAENSDDAAIVEAICALSRSLRFKVIVEGIETREQLDYVNSLAVSGVQGDLFSRPIPASEVEEALSNLADGGKLNAAV